MFAHTLDHTVLSGRISPFEDDQNTLAMGDDLALYLDQFDLQRAQLLLVFAFGYFLLSRTGHVALRLFSCDNRTNPEHVATILPPATVLREGTGPSPVLGHWRFGVFHDRK